MGLGIGEGDEVRVTCRGKDCEAALQALVAALSVADRQKNLTRR